MIYSSQRLELRKSQELVEVVLRAFCIISVYSGLYCGLGISRSAVGVIAPSRAVVAETQLQLPLLFLSQSNTLSLLPHHRLSEIQPS